MDMGSTSQFHLNNWPTFFFIPKYSLIIFSCSYLQSRLSNLFSSIVWEVKIIFSNFEMMGLLAWAMDIPHFEICPLQVSNLHLQVHGDIEHLFLKIKTMVAAKIKVLFTLTQRSVSNRGQVRRTAFNLFVRDWSFALFNARETES